MDKENRFAYGRTEPLHRNTGLFCEHGRCVSCDHPNCVPVNPPEIKPHVAIEIGTDTGLIVNALEAERKFWMECGVVNDETARIIANITNLLNKIEVQL